ncbi:ATP-binding protein [Candidatus Dependentiae bacterium]|nr:ATP-binding protein [Candidatus Dependentiae bacterium]
MDYKKRIVESRIAAFTAFYKIILLTGARQVGKSSLFSHLFPTVKSVVFDPVQDIYNVRNNPDLFLQDFGKPIILDEVQFIPEILPALKRFADKSEEKGQYLLTGSQQFSIIQSITESLAGRVVILPLGIMTPHEMYDEFDETKNWFLRYLREPATFHTQQYSRLRNLPSRLEVIWRGGMPGTIGIPNDALPSYFSSYIQTYVERDIRLMENIQELSTFGKFLSLLAALSAQEINYSELGRELGITPKTAQRWLQLLTYTYQWVELSPFHMNAIKRLSSKPKGIIADTGIACYLQRISSPTALAASPAQGAFFESFCFNMLKGFCSALPLMPNFYHWRTLAGAEVDMIIELDGVYYPIKVKTATTVSRQDIRGIEAFKETYPHLNIAQGVVLYAGDAVYRVTETITAVPWDLH